MSDIQYLITNHYYAFAVVFSNVSSYYARIDLIYKRMSLLKLLLKLLSSLSSSDDSQQTLDFIYHLLSNFRSRSKISMKILLLQKSSFYFLNAFKTC